MTATTEQEPTTLTDPARLAAVAVLSAAGVTLSPDLDLDAATVAMRRELAVAAVKGEG
jgi:hypothetical protein